MSKYSNIVWESRLLISQNFESVLRDGRKVEGILQEPMIVSWDDSEGNRWRLSVPKSFAAAPSIPTRLRGIIPAWGPIFWPSIVHDWCYFTQCMSREDSDTLFLYLMESMGMGWFSRNAAYSSVRALGWTMYKKNNFKPNSGPVPVQDK